VLRCGRRHGCEPAAPVRAGELPNYGLGRLTGQPLHGAYRARALPVHAPASMRCVSSVSRQARQEAKNRGLTCVNLDDFL
jgi:hypothetical protein